MKTWRPFEKDGMMRLKFAQQSAIEILVRLGHGFARESIRADY
jgi:hypothetical protein